MSDTPHPTGFRTVMRGYDTSQVDRAVTELQHALESARAESAERSVQVTKLQAMVDELSTRVSDHQARVQELEDERKHTPPPSFAELGERIGSMLSLAQQESTEMRDRARTEAETTMSEARDAATRHTENAHRQAADVTTKAQADATALVEGARRQADEILDHADREATARREEAEAVYEHQRARAAAAAADFEKTLAERRDKAAAEFSAQMQANEQVLARAEERLVAFEAEADRLRQESRDQAESLLRTARDEATTLVEQARGSAERIRRESQRELSAATARRDAITAQLHNVRQMLATLGAGQVADPFAEPDAGDTPATAIAPESVPESTVPEPNVVELDPAADVSDGSAEVAGKTPVGESAEA